MCRLAPSVRHMSVRVMLVSLWPIRELMVKNSLKYVEGIDIATRACFLRRKYWKNSWLGPEFGRRITCHPVTVAYHQIQCIFRPRPENSMKTTTTVGVLHQAMVYYMNLLYWSSYLYRQGIFCNMNIQILWWSLAIWYCKWWILFNLTAALSIFASFDKQTIQSK